MTHSTVSAWRTSVATAKTSLHVRRAPLNSLLTKVIDIPAEQVLSGSVPIGPDTPFSV